MKENKNKRSFKKIFLVTLSAVLLIFTIGIVLLLTQIPPKSFVAMMETDFENGSPGIFKSMVGEFESEIDVENLPKILVNNEGESVETPEQFEQRKNEMMEMFYSEVYGQLPDISYDVEFEELVSEDILNGRAVRKQIEMTITTEYGSSKALILGYIPVTEEAVPTVVALNFKGNTVIDGDSSIIASYGNNLSGEELEETRGDRSERWPYEMLVDSGYALFTVCADDFAPDNKKEYKSRLISIFPEDEEIKAIATWSFGLERVIDYVVTQETLDENRIVTFGHSRMGKTSLLTGANDERVALAISNGSGNTGAAISRNSYGETINIINLLFPYWFVDEYDKYEKNEEEMPFDQHMLLASIAPRQVYVSSSDGDLWAFPHGEYTSLAMASEAYTLFGYTDSMSENMPTAPTVIHNEYFGYHIKEDKHAITVVDWEHYIEYMDKYLK